MNNLNLPAFTGGDVFTRAEDCPLNRVSFFRVHEATANSPYGSGFNDFWYYVNKLESYDFIRIVAFDIWSDKIYTNSKVGGTWGSWKVQSCITSVHTTITMDGNGNGFTGYSTNSEYMPISFKPTYDNYPTIIVCDSSGNYWLKPFDWGNFVIKPNFTLEGDLILQRQK